MHHPKLAKQDDPTRAYGGPSFPPLLSFFLLFASLTPSISHRYWMRSFPEATTSSIFALTSNPVQIAVSDLSISSLQKL